MPTNKSKTSAGKKFEELLKKSIPDYCMVHRLKDTAQSYNESAGTRFTWNNPCDFFVFNSESHFLYALELKSTKYKTINYSLDENSDGTKMIKYHQICSLKKLSEYDGIIAGFILNFRDEENGMERTYFQHIEDFLEMISKINKASFNEINLLMNRAIKIDGIKKRVNYQWDIEKLFNKIECLKG